MKSTENSETKIGKLVVTGFLPPQEGRVQEQIPSPFVVLRKASYHYGERVGVARNDRNTESFLRLYS